MITPQQIDQVAFKKSSFGGYNMQQVDEFLEPLTEDYVTLYKENALLKSKLRVLAGKLEEYRKGEGAAKAASTTPPRPRMTCGTGRPSLSTWRMWTRPWPAGWCTSCPAVSMPWTAT